MKYVTLFFLLLCVSSCEYFDKKKVSTDEILQEDLRTFNWNEVDEYPSFKSCSSSGTKELRKQCFENTLINHITSFLIDQKIIVTKDINDTINIKFHISEKGELRVLQIDNSTSIKNQIPEIDGFLKKSLITLPQISPAIKRGQQVKTEFKLPIHIKVG